MLLVFRVVLISYIFATVASQNRKNLVENQSCGEGSNRGTCKKAEECGSLQDALRRGNRPPVCGSAQDRSVLICCPATDSPERERRTTLDRKQSQSTPTPFNRGNQKKSISQQKCEEYAELVFEKSYVVPLADAEVEYIDQCAWNVDEQIVGGEKAKPKVYIHMALVGYGEDKDWLCGGSLISERFVLSAAHCNEVQSRPASWIRLGEFDIDSDLDDSSPEDFRISKRIVHPQYNKARSYNDIALFEMERKVIFDSFKRPICLHNSYDINGGKSRPVVTGWGHTSFRGRFSSVLLQLKINLFDSNICRARFKRFETNKSLIPYGIDDNIMVCAGGVEGEDACQGDSGGPLQIPLEKPYCMFSQVGIVSFGNKCAVGEPGIYTRVSSYIRWIESIVWPS